jgi:hypothetical protein
MKMPIAETSYIQNEVRYIAAVTVRLSVNICKVVPPSTERKATFRRAVGMRLGVAELIR